MKRPCLFCKKELKGRRDKKFCDVYCKSAYQYKKSIEETPKFYTLVDKQLKLNRKLLKAYNKSGKSIVRLNILVDLGFNPNYFTHYWKNKQNDVYFFVYEYGFLKKKDNGKDKLVLVTWQEYMKAGN